MNAVKVYKVKVQYTEIDDKHNILILSSDLEHMPQEVMTNKKYIQ